MYLVSTYHLKKVCILFQKVDSLLLRGISDLNFCIMFRFEEYLFFNHLRGHSAL